MSESDTDFLKKMQDEALSLAASIGSADHWAKPFYSSVATLYQGVPRAFIGLNGAGDRYAHVYDKQDRNHERCWTNKSYNAVLDDRWGDELRAWPPGAHSHQRAIQAVFKAMYGDNYQSVLRSTACYNIVPVSAKGQGDPVLKQIWTSGSGWGIRLTEYLRPRLLILNGNGAAQKSAWFALAQRFTFSGGARPLPLENAKYYSLKEAMISDGALAGCRVIGLPHLSHNKASPLLLAGLKERAPFT